MINTSHTHHQSTVKLDNDNDINQSIEVTEVQHHAAGQYANRLINRRIVFYNNQQPLRFGRAEPLPAGGWRVVVTRYLRKIIKCLGIVTLFLLALLGVIHLASNASSPGLKGISYDEYESLIMKGKIPCDCSKTITEDELNTNNNDEIFAPMPYDELDVQEIFKETEVVDNSTCALYDLFSYVFNKLCSLKDDIIGIIPTKPQNDTDSIGDNHEKLGQSASATDNSFVSEFDQNGAVSNEDNRPTFVNIPPLNSSELFVGRNTT